jgi:hypothetical protein
MQDRPVPGPEGPPAGPSDQPFLTPIHYPADGSRPPAGAAPPAARTGGGRLLTRVILPLVLFVTIVAGTAYVTQNLRSGRTLQPVTRAGPPVLQFEQTEAVWKHPDPEVKNYAAEFEFGSADHYDFPFANPGPVPVELGLSYTSCGCSMVKVGLLGLAELEAFKKDRKDERISWQTLPKGETKGITVPPHSGGIVRLGWEVRKIISHNTLLIKLWSQPAGRVRDPETVLQAAVAFVMPVRFSPQIKDFGNLGPRGKAPAEFWFWSATRDHFDLEVKDKTPDPCFVYHVSKPLSEAECRVLGKDLRERGFLTLVKSAYRVTVDIHAEREGKQLDLGPFVRNLPMVVDHAVADEQAGPQLKGWVRGDIVVGTAEEAGRIDLKSFPVNSPREKLIPLWTDAGVKLVTDQVPDFLDVELKAKATANNKTRWELRVRVKPQLVLPGPLPEDSAILLRMDGTPPRRIRIPVQGTAVQG